jgi:hypothetical protein
MTVDPKVSFWIGLITVVALVLGNGAVWTDVVPNAWIPMIKSVNGLIGLIGTTVLTYLHGVSAAKQGPLV